MDKRIAEARKMGFLRWECDVVLGHTTFTFLGYTKAGATRKAANFVMEVATKGAVK